MLKIGFDAKRALFNNSGLGNYSRDTLQLLAEACGAENLHLYSPKPIGKSDYASQFASFPIHGPEKALHKVLPSYWRSKGLLKQLQADGIELYHGLSNELPLGISQTSIRSVVTIHDVIFMRHPEWYPRFDRWMYQAKTEQACKEADLILAISQQTKDDLIEFFQVPEEKIQVVYQGCHSKFKTALSEETLKKVQQKYQLPEHFVLNVGRIEARKNGIHLVEAMHQCPEVPLVFAGRWTDYQDSLEQKIKQMGLESRVKIINDVPLDDLVALYQLADIFVYPSHFEGFGIPLIEASFSGTPVISSTGSCFSEAGGPHAIYVDSTDSKALASSILDLWNHPSKRQEQVSKTNDFLERFHPQTIQKALISAYERLAE